jgi:hypothetical protein
VLLCIIETGDGGDFIEHFVYNAFSAYSIVGGGLRPKKLVTELIVLLKNEVLSCFFNAILGTQLI